MKSLVGKSLPVGLQAWPDDSHLLAGFFNKNINLEEIKTGLVNNAPLLSVKQVHGNAVHVVTSANQSQIAPPLEGDALITDLRQVGLVVHTADCIPLLATDGNWIGACHAGWRGVSVGVIPEWIKKMISRGVNPEKIKVAMGPSIGPCHFEVGDDVGDQITSKIPHELQQSYRLPHKDKSKVYIKLAEIARWQLLTCGLKLENISQSAQCTHCDPVNFYSYRRDGPRIGRMEAVIVRY